jgi:hypothetical protein
MKAATQLGWSAAQWDEGMAPSCPLMWMHLSTEQVASAEILGYDSTSWNWDEESVDDSHDTASDDSVGSEEFSQSASSESSSESEEDEMDEFGRALAPISNLTASKPIKFTLKTQPNPTSMAANDDQQQAAEDEVWWNGDGIWETQVAEDSEDEPFRYEFTTQADGTVNIVRLDGEDKISEGTASYDGDTIDAEVFGGQFSAEITDGGVTLVWSDGDEWSRVSTRRKAVAPRRRLLSKAAAASASPNPTEALQMKPIVVASPVAPPAFPKAATPSFSFSPAPAAAVMPPTSCQPVFTFSSSTNKPAAPVFSFPDIPVTPAVCVPATLGVAVSDEDSSPAAEEPSADSEKQGEDTDGAPEDTEEAPVDAQETVIPDCYEQQLEILVNFYAKYESDKSESDCKAILDKRKGNADAMTTLQFSKLCGKLAAKYGANPMDIPSAAAEQTAAISQGVRHIDTASKQSDCDSTASPKAASGWNATKNEQAACGSTWACEVCLVKNDDAVLLCAACETCKPGCEEEAARAKKEAQDKKEAEMKENMLASAAAVKAAGITFGLPSASTVNKPTVGLFAKPISEKALPTSNQSTVNMVNMDTAGALDWLHAHVRLDDDGMQKARKAFQDKSMTGALLEAATMQTLKSEHGILSWGVRLKIHLALSHYKETQRTASACGKPKSAGVVGVQQGHTERNAVKTFSPIQSPRSALSAIRVN